MHDHFLSIANQICHHSANLNDLISEYHESVLEILPARNLPDLFGIYGEKSIHLAHASGGLFCIPTNNATLTINICMHDCFKSDKTLPFPIKQVLPDLFSRRFLFSMSNTCLSPVFKQFSLSSENLLIFPLCINKKITGLLLLFENTRYHAFTPADVFLVSLLTETVSSVARNLIEFRMHRRRARTDPLTGLLNRQTFLSQTDYEIRRSLRYDRSMALCLFDIDYFKEINDHWGHPAGDIVLISLANKCRTMLRTVDLIARFGGDEFVILFTETAPDIALEAIERFRLAVSLMPITYHSESIPLSLSIGIASLHPDCISPEKLIERADAAMYHAKHSGRNRTVLWNKMIEEKKVSQDNGNGT